MDLAERGDPQTKTEALNLLAEWKEADANRLVVKALQSTNVEEKRSAVEMCYRQRIDQAFPILMKMGDDKDPLVRRYLSAALAIYGDKQAIPVLLKLLHDPYPDPFIKIWAADALGKLGRKDGVPDMIDLLKREDTKSFRGNIVHTLQDITGKQLEDDYGQWNAWWQSQGKQMGNGL